jgi:hypothetical protein
MRLPFFGPVVPPHVFCLRPDGVTYASARREPPAGISMARFFAYPTGTVTGDPPRFTREAVAEAVEAARRLAGGRLSRASVVFPDAWARVQPVEFDDLPSATEAVQSMVVWKLKKLRPNEKAELTVAYRQMPSEGKSRRLLVASAPTETLRSIEQSFEAVGVRVGSLLPESLSLFEGLGPLLTSRTGGDWALLHRSRESFVFAIASAGRPVLFRQRPSGEDEGSHDQELRLSLSYYAEKLRGKGLSAVYLHDSSGQTALSDAIFPTAPSRLSANLLGADPSLDERVTARPELLAAFAAVYGRP